MSGELGPERVAGPAPVTDAGAGEVRFETRTTKRRGLAGRPLARLGWQVGITVAALCGWQYLPQINVLSEHISLLNRFYVSSPSAVAATLVDTATGAHHAPLIWPYLQVTVVATLLGALIGLVTGALMGLLLSNSPGLTALTRPFVAFTNSIPRIALIPIFILVFGPTIRASVANVAITVFFIAFFNAFEGGTAVQQAVLENVMLLGANRYQVMFYIRLPMVVAWTFAAVPNAIAFGLAVAVTTELMAGINGIGYLLLTATTNVEAALTFALVVLLSVVGLVLYLMANWLRARVLRWQGK